MKKNIYTTQTEDIENFLKWQDEINNNDFTNWKNFFTLVFTISKRLIYKELSNHNHYKNNYTHEEVYNYAINATIYFIRRYIKDNKYNVKAIFTSIGYANRHALFYHAMKDDERPILYKLNEIYFNNTTDVKKQCENIEENFYTYYENN